MNAHDKLWRASIKHKGIRLSALDVFDLMTDIAIRDACDPENQADLKASYGWEKKQKAKEELQRKELK